MPTYLHPIAIASAGCFLPKANGLTQFWKLLQTGERCFVDAPWSGETYVGEQDFQTRSSLGGFINQKEVTSVRERDPTTRKNLTRGQVFALAAADQLELPEDFHQSRVGIAVGCMGFDGAVSEGFLLSLEGELRNADPASQAAVDDYFQKLRTNSPSEKDLTATALLNCLQTSLNLKGPSCLVDAACASSIAAMEVACSWINEGKCDYVITGGVESSLQPEMFGVFSRLGVLSPQGSGPFGDKADGIVPSEGAALFLLARADKIKIPLGIVRAIKGNSNGRSSSLFSPSAERMSELYAWAREQFEKFDFIECHATSTPIGDQAEVAALNKALSGTPTPTPIGSTKGHTGHVLGAAGAVSVLKTLLSFRHRQLPRHQMAGQPIEALKNAAVFVPNAPYSLESAATLRAAIFSAGFGGANYCAIIENGSVVTGGENTLPSTDYVRVGFARCEKQNALERAFEIPAHIPPLLARRADAIALAAVAATAEALDRSLLRYGSVDSDRVCLISAGSLASDSTRELVDRTRFLEFSQVAPHLAPRKYETLLGLAPARPLEQEEGAEALNSAVTGRVAMEFHFTGKSFHVDAGKESAQYAIELAHQELKNQEAELAIVLAIEEELASHPRNSLRKAVTAHLFARRDHALAKGWPQC